MSSTLTFTVLADREDLGGMVDVAPRELGDVDQAVDPVEVDEGAEVHDVGDRALDDLAGLEAVQDLLANLLALLLEHRATREHDVVAAAVELDHLALDRLAQELVEVLDAADVDQRRGQEAAHAEVDDQAALDDLDHGALDRLAGFGRGLDPAPGLLEAGALLREQQAAVLVLLGEDEGIHLLAQLRPPRRGPPSAGSTARRGDDALRLVADVDQDLVLVDPDDLAAHHVALLEGLDRRVVVRDELAVDLDQEVVRSRLGAVWAPPGAACRRCGTRPNYSGRGRRRGRDALDTLAADAERRTKRGAERTPLGGDYDVLICGASFAGPGGGARAGRRGEARRVLIVDRYEVGERQTSACAAPTEWLDARSGSGPTGRRSASW